jgi:N-acetylneuraminic acid mutarotase
MKSVSSFALFMSFVSTTRLSFRLSRKSVGFGAVAMLILASSACLFAQTGEWAWMGGSSTPNQHGVYGTLGVAAPSNVPGGRALSAMWTDSSGNHWMFGGQGYDAAGTLGLLNDLWELNASTGQWVWMGGGTIVPRSGLGQPGVYGTLGVPAAANTPGGRGGAATWTDNNGNLWLFGGQGVYTSASSGYELNDLWEFSPVTHEWTWMGGGVTPAQAGTQGVPAAGNIPAGRDTAVSWTDASGKFWLFGGENPVFLASGGGSPNFMNDLWEFDPATTEWAWMGGSISQSVGGVYGTEGILSTSNFPGSRAGANLWTDSFGNRWLFGGEGLDATFRQGFLNDLWQLSSSYQEWAWMAGVNIDGGYSTTGEFGTLYGTAGVYGTLGQAASGNAPGGRVASANWIDANGNLWIFGGEGFDSTGKFGFLNDVWQFNPVTREWAWMGGNNVVGSNTAQPIYGIPGTPASGNTPGGRLGAISWTDNSGNLWLFGGLGTSPTTPTVFFNDLWEYQTSVPASPPAATPTFSPASGTYSSPLTVTISDATPGATIYCAINGITPTTNSAVCNGQFTFSSNITIEAIAFAPGYDQSAVASVTYTIAPPTATPTFSVPSGTYSSPLTVTISDAMPGATIYCTMNGTTPTTNSPVCSGPSTITSTTTVEAIAVAKGYAQSAVASATYTIAPLSTAAATPTFSVAQGTYPSPLTVMINDGIMGATIYYTTNGTAPTTSSAVYGRPIAVSGTETIEAIAIATGYLPSPVAAATYTISPSTTLGEWAWMGGSSTVPSLDKGQPGVYGTLGVPSAGNAPGGLVSAVSWTDKSGNFWLFGGFGTDSNGNSGLFNDLWKFYPSIGEWVWISGNSTLVEEEFYHLYGSPAVYGSLGVPAAGNTPGGRSGSATWTDASGNLWLFGGQGFDPSGAQAGLNDLWEFNISTNLWAWMGGPTTEGGVPGCNPGVYGTLAVAAAGNIPGCRSGAVTWTDSGGNLWLFGGSGDDSKENGGYLNDLWEFNPSTLQWTWMGGSSTLPNGAMGQPGAYGTIGVAAAGNIPGGRSNSAFWTDQNGNFWVFGGEGFDSTGTQGELNDLWEFNPASNLWMWVSGSNVVGQPSSYGIAGIAAPGNVPGSRAWASSWTDAAGDLWLFGGESANDLWEFNPSTSEWAWMGGIGQTNQAGVYGLLGVPSLGDIPGGRSSAVTWSDHSGNLWLFGGQGNDSADTVGFLNDLWEFQPAALTATPSFSVAAGSYSTAQTVSISDATPGAIIYYTLDGSTPTTSSTAYSGAITVSSSETLEAIAVASGYRSSAVASAAYTIVQTPAIAWATPAAITYGTALGALQLDASSIVPGTFSYSPAAGTVLGVGNQTLSVTFTPTDTTDYTTATATVTLTVNQATPTITWATPSAITYGTALGALQLNATSTVAGTFSYSPAEGTVLGVGTQTLSVTFTPTDSTDYTMATATVSLTVSQATPTVTWSAPAAITYGTALGASQLNATSTVAGTFSYSAAAGTVLGAGTQTLTVTFTPTDTTDYAAVTASVSIVVNKATPTLTWPAPGAIVYGTALSSAQLDAAANVAGTLTYSPAAGAVLGAGTQSLSVTFTPTDSTDYNATTTAVNLTVNKATPTISWPTPAAIAAGTPLGSAQLDASASAPGTFTYTPPAGMVLPAGNQTLATVFTPSDSADYNTATASVVLVVVAPSFTLNATSSSLSLTQGKSGTDTVTVIGQGGFNSNVTLSASGLPAGVTATFGRNPTSGNSTLTFTANASAVPGTYVVAVKGISGSLSATTTITLTVQSGFACHVGYSITKAWTGEFQAALSINNTGTGNITDWTLTWTFANGQKIESLWNGNETQSGANLTVTNMDYNGTIKAGSSYKGAGFTGTWNNVTNAVPTNFAINGTPCQ